MGGSVYQAIRDSLTQMYVADPRPWLVGFSGGNSRFGMKRRSVSREST